MYIIDGVYSSAQLCVFVGFVSFGLDSVYFLLWLMKCVRVEINSIEFCEVFFLIPGESENWGHTGNPGMLLMGNLATW